ncbi:hypothetical protein X560_0479 [Listeria fleischmannii 1991]|uniref:Uncharacterized protein n=1 Tax=Listeria fleischmannii 1991 TaxID=1430899 RepID=A0A0J8GJ69_9LIST|nr:hypothetical protein X560_0479 [Listeria fleischmannii 1991]
MHIQKPQILAKKQLSNLKYKGRYRFCIDLACRKIQSLRETKRRTPKSGC